MSSSEAEILKRVHLAIGGLPGVRVFRNQVGQGIAGTVVEQLGPNLFVVRGSRVVMGLCKGSADLVGWRQLLITSAMVGGTVAQFLAIETKTANGNATEDQMNFLNRLREAGGCGGIARSADEALALVKA